MMETDMQTRDLIVPKPQHLGKLMTWQHCYQSRTGFIQLRDYILLSMDPVRQRPLHHLTGHKQHSPLRKVNKETTCWPTIHTMDQLFFHNFVLLQHLNVHLDTDV